jgi:hypothetical protein
MKNKNEQRSHRNPPGLLYPTLLQERVNHIVSKEKKINPKEQ